jgi:hypothetical protein
MPKWRKATWALLVWTAIFAIWIVGGVGSVSNNCAGQTGDALTACQAGTAIGGGLAVTFILVIWFVGFVVIGLVWLMSRPKENVVVYGPQGQHVTVSEKEAKRRVEKQGWSYTSGSGGPT